MDHAGMKRRELQALSKRHGLPAGGSNADLVARLDAVLLVSTRTRYPRKAVKCSSSRQVLVEMLRSFDLVFLWECLAVLLLLMLLLG